MNTPILTMIVIKDEEELEKYSNKMNNAIIKESVDNLKRLNSDAAFVYDLTPEEDANLLKENFPIDMIIKPTGLTEENLEIIE